MSTCAFPEATDNFHGSKNEFTTMPNSATRAGLQIVPRDVSFGGIDEQNYKRSRLRNARKSGRRSAR
jgi:hypothetical protein